MKGAIDMASLVQPIQPELMDVEEAAGFCHVKTSTMRSWVLQKKVTYVKLGRRVFLRKSDLETLIDASVVPAEVRQGAPASVAIAIRPSTGTRAGVGGSIPATLKIGATFISAKAHRQHSHRPPLPNELKRRRLCQPM